MPFLYYAIDQGMMCSEWFAYSSHRRASEASEGWAYPTGACKGEVGASA